MEFFKDESEMTGEMNVFGREHSLLLLCTAAAIRLFRHRDRLRRGRRRESLRYVLAGLSSADMAVAYGVFAIGISICPCTSALSAASFLWPC